MSLDLGSLSKFLKMGGPELALELVDRFLSEAPHRLAEARAAYGRGEFLPIEEHCHRLASDSGWLGAKDFQKLASKAEILALERKLSEIDPVLVELETRLPILLEQLPEVKKALKEGRDPCDSA